jgi:hypothetical protein
MPFRSEFRSPRMRRVDRIIDVVVGLLILLLVILVALTTEGWGKTPKGPKFQPEEIYHITIDTKHCTLLPNGRYHCTDVLVILKPEIVDGSIYHLSK